MLSFLKRIFDHPSIQFLAESLSAPDQNSGPVFLFGLARPAKALVIAALARRLRRPLIVLTTDNEAAERLGAMTATFFGWFGEPASAVVNLPFFDVTPYESRSPHPEIAERRAIALGNIAANRVRALFAPAPVACQRFRNKSYYHSLSLNLALGDEISIGDLIDHLAGTGYESHEPADSVGCYSMRGGIIDVFPPLADWPFRIEFLGDQIESIREFDPDTQRSRRPVEA
ncbi:MAG: transcription-repair coupling factor, partial [Terriglobia bacterium]